MKGKIEQALRTLLGLTPEEWSSELQEIVSRNLPDELRAVVGPGFRVKGSVGDGKRAPRPWVVVNRDQNATGASSGTYVAYLFAADGSAVYLCLTQAVQKRRPAAL